ncbi:hypothetical protein HHL17_15320 [Chitinophaga sp. G-6-1-13]|uniref:Uncharacterized protein n=1 Tax=Chitinophaga fulva TaxID=2728842 RepID=A0A848GKY2_9BACT|nr:hypothetical protein [Chitinophaga fulva]NML38577.1 hypothetical protein [Chitinophaga fulva]
MQQEYTYSRGFRIFVFCLIAPFALVPLLAIGTAMVVRVTSPLETFYGFLAGVPGMALVTYCINELLSVVASDAFSIRYQSFLYHRELLWQEVKGYQLKEGSLVLVPTVTGKRKIKISNRRGKSRELADWVESRYPDLGKISETATVADDKISTVAPYELRIARKTAWVLNITAFVVMMLCFFFLRSLPWLPLILVLLLPVALIALLYHKGQPVFIDRKKEPFPVVLLTIIFSAIGLFVFAVPIFSLALKELWLGALVASGVFAIGIIFAIRHWKTTPAKKAWGVISFIIFCTPAFFESIVYLNTFFDHSAPQLFETTVFDKRISKRKSTSYFLVVKPWGPVTSARSISVGKRRYEVVHVNDMIIMELHKGAFGMPWYTPQLLKR